MFESKLTDRRTLAIASLVLLAILLVAVNALSGRLFRGVALDFTQDKLFSLSSGTRTVLANIDEPITLKFYYSRKLGEAAPSFLPYITRVRELLERYQDLAGGKIRLEIHNPEPFTDTEDRAVGAGLQGIRLSRRSDEKGFFGIVGTNSTDDEETIAFFHPNRERFLEYDLTRMVSRLAKPKKKVIGLLTNLRMGSRPTRANRRGRPWVLLTQLNRRFTFRQITPDVTKIDDDVDVLMIVHPKKPKPAMLYAIDQFILRGGKAIIFVDPHSESSQRASRFGMLMVDTGSDISKLLGAWGIEVVKDKVVGDPTLAVRVQAPSADGRSRQIIEYLAWMSLGQRNMNREDVVTAELRRVNIASPGAIKQKKGSTVKLIPLLITSPRSMQIDAMKLRFRPNLAQLIADYKSGGQALVMAARLKGKVKSVFPKGPPLAKPAKPKKPPTTAAEKKKAEEAKAAAAKLHAKLKAKHLAEAKVPINVIVIADTDFMDDRFWVTIQQSGGQSVAVAGADNGAFVINAIDNLAGEGALIGLRSRGHAARPFTLVQSIQQAASVKFRAKEQGLIKKIESTRKKLGELRSKTDRQGKTILSPAQVRTIEQFRAEMIKSRLELRQVQLALRQDIDRLETRLQFFMIGAVPIVIALFAAFVSLVRRQRRRARHAVAQG